MTSPNIVRFFAEVRRRRVLRVAALYVVGAWVVLQAADLAFPAFDIISSAIKYVWIGAILGFPMSLFLGWRYSFVSGRVIRTADLNASADLSLMRADYFVLSSLASVAISIVFYLGTTITDNRQQSENIAWFDDVDPTSIAVLPFVNMSPDPDNEYLAEGISEELLNALASIQGLPVSARTSSFSFKGKNVDVPTIGQQLKVANVLEGSVRMSGDTIRVTAQLINSVDGTHRWSNTYDRPMQDIFAIQDEITTNIVLALRKTMNIREIQSFPPGSTSNIDAYRHYLRGRALSRTYNAATDVNFREAISEYKTAIQIDPDYGDAYVALVDGYRALSYWFANRYEGADAVEIDSLMQAAAESAIRISPDSSEAFRALGEITDDLEAKERAFQQAIELDSGNVYALMDLAFLKSERNPGEAVDLGRKAQRLDPLNYATSTTLAELLWRNGQLKESSDYWRLSTELSIGDSDRGRKPREEFLAMFAKLPANPLNLDYQKGTRHWALNPECDDVYAFEIAGENSSGRVYASIKSTQISTGWCNTAQRINARNFAGKYIRLSGKMRVKAVDGRAYFWLKATGINDLNYGFGNGEYSPMVGDSDWTDRELRIYVPKDARTVQYGVVLEGNGQLWNQLLRLDASDNPDFN